MTGSVVIMPPLTVDPPLHARYRAIINPFMAPSKVRTMTDKAREIAIELIEAIRKKDRCEFKKEFASILPVVMFLGIVDLPLDRREEFVAMAKATEAAAQPISYGAAIFVVALWVVAAAVLVDWAFSLLKD